jgi:hypothetical protein
MTFARILEWRWIPRRYRASHPDAPYRNLVHVGFWLILWEKKHDR